MLTLANIFDYLSYYVHIYVELWNMDHLVSGTIATILQKSVLIEENSWFYVLLHAELHI